MKLTSAITFYIPKFTETPGDVPGKNLLTSPCWNLGRAMRSDQEQSFVDSTRLAVTDQNMFHLNFQIISIPQLGTHAKKDVENKKRKTFVNKSRDDENSKV